MSILSKIITRAIVKPALRGKVKPLPPRGSQRTQMEALGFNKAPEDIPEDMPIVAPDTTRVEVPEEGMSVAKDVGQQKRMNLIYGIRENEPSLVQQLDEAIEAAPPITPIETPQIRAEMDKLVPSAGGRGGGKGGRGVINEDTAPLEEIEKFYKLPENQRQAQTPQLKEAAQALQRKDITKQEFDEIADTFYPAKLITEMPEPPHVRRIEAVLGKKVKSRPVVDETISKELDGKRFGTRLDIPAYNIYDTWVVTVHGTGKAGKALHYSKTAYLTDVVFMSDPSKALKVATEDTTKIPFARMEGRWKDMTPDDVYDLAAEELNKPNSKWVQIGMNPYKHSYFYDKITMQPILSALEVIQVGPLVLARNVKRGKASDFAFEEGGVVDMRDGGRVRMEHGGQASLSDFETPEQIAEMERRIQQNRKLAQAAGFKNFSEYHKANYAKRLKKARNANDAYWKKYGPMGNFQSRQLRGGETGTEFILPPGYNFSDETINAQNTLIKSAYAFRNRDIKEKNKAAGFTPITQKYLDALGAKEEEEYERTGERTGYVNLAQLQRDYEKQQAQIAQDRPVVMYKGGVVDMRRGGVTEARKGFSAETEKAKKHRTETGLRKEFSLLPTNARVFIESVLLGEKSPISEKDFTKDELDAIKRIILASQQIKLANPSGISEAGKPWSTTAEEQQPTRKYIMPSKKGVVDYLAYRKIDDLGSEGFGFLNTISPIGRIKTTLGQFGYKRLPNGDVLVGDEYDFSKYYSDDVSIGERILDGIFSLGYKPIRQYASEVIPEGSGRKVEITIPREQFTDKEYKSLFGDEISTLNMLMMSKGGVVDMRDGSRVRMAKGGSTSYQATPEFLKYLISVENPGSEGLKGGKWYPYPSTGKNKDTHDEIGYGIEILKDTYAAGLTQKQIDTLFKERLMKASEEASRVVDKQLGSGTFSSLSRKKQDAFVDYAYNLGEGTHIRSIDKKTGKIKDKYTGFTAYKKFIPAVVNDDREAVLREYKRHVKQSDGKWAELGRNKHFMKYFSEFFPEKERSRASYSFSYFPKQTIL